MRIDGRTSDELRSVNIIPNWSPYAEGSCLVEFGQTRVLCTASVEATVPKWLSGSGKGWVTAEYGMLPRSTHTRIRRDQAMEGGRTQEISRLIGRSLRAITSLELMNEKSVIVDCDVLQADGGTRTAAITGGFVALALAFHRLRTQGTLTQWPLKDYLAAVSIGLGETGALLDLNYTEDSSISTDMNFVLTGKGHFVEVQGTAEKNPFSAEDMVKMTNLARSGCERLFSIQENILKAFFPR